ncbi:hypothetical protein HYY72_00260 [Candidatus Woesearchaeota archaeon]|nr:hypothetical protein [Candidatus Woesearchaeota archaeon]
MNEWKSFCGVLIVVLMTLVLSLPVKAEVSDSANIQVTMINQEPNPVEPGERVIVRFRVENLGSRPVNDLGIEVLQDFPFTVADGNAVKFLGTITGRQIDKQGATANFNIIVDPKAGEGDSNELYMRYKTSSGISTKTGPFNISIKTRQALVAIDSIKSSPEQALPGERLNVSLDVRNNAASSIRNLQVRLDFSNAALPFAPLGSPQEQSAGYLDSMERKSFVFGMISSPNAAAGIYKVPIKLSYSDQLGKNFTRDDLLSLIIGGRPSITALISEQGVLARGKTGELTVQVVNNGLINVKLASVELKSSQDYEILSPSKVYIGAIDSDDFDSSKFKIYIKKDARQVRLPLEITYRDANNNGYTDYAELVPRVYSDEDAQKYGLEGRSLTGFFIIGAILLAGILAYSRLFRKRE